MNKVRTPNAKDRVLLIYPAYPGEKQKPNRPPLGLLTIAAPLVEQGIEVCLLDERVNKDFNGRLCGELKKNPLCVGISSMSGSHISGALRVSRMVKEQSNIPVVWGGVHASLEPQSTIQHSLVDFIVRDDGEETFPKLLACLKDPTANLRRIRGIGFKERSGRVVLTETAYPAQIENLPPVPFFLAELDRYSNSQRYFALGKNILPMETSRGCPFNCLFCTESVRKKKWRALSPERVVSDIKQNIQKYGIRDFCFIDDNFFGDIRRSERIIELLIQEHIGIKWFANMRVDYMADINSDSLARLEQSGCRTLTFGAESGSERILEMISKYSSKEEIITANQKIARSVITPHFATIVGFPTERRKDIANTLLLMIQLLLENKKAICDYTFLIPTPGTKIAEQCLPEEQHNYSLEDWAKIFDLMKGRERSPWLPEETFDFIKRYKKVLRIISLTNRKTLPWWRNMTLRLFLRIARMVLAREV